jgi:hypothetical protein
MKYVIIASLWILLVCALIFVLAKQSPKKPPPEGKCSKKCGAIDPVSDPAYNMKEIAKQSLLLEEHLVEKNKRCKDCIAKHFLHIIALSEEAVCLAGSRLPSYPLMDTNAAFYERLFQKWLMKKTAEDNLRAIEDELRARRKELVATYVLTD